MAILCDHCIKAEPGNCITAHASYMEVGTGCRQFSPVVTISNTEQDPTGRKPRDPWTINDPQPMPTPNDHPAVWSLVMSDMLERDRMGQKKYNTRLQPHNGRDFLIDAYQELLDGAVYLRGLLYERDGK